ncbi:hypothetical protein [Mesorhizobium sp.]|uniref:hypothetical protein n=1 Tax=Mesorhizobium sp. TaxID=1871066 RepID=UPI000FE3245F|nr:hypothetical protein [Mesorhizobium sp.]RWH72047.1 MAG: hypothetical protein EOQ84_13400 [Mesorhizobium sp.]RWL33055.1 MAG: hypothetical protein EOR58_04095 [Mesorhizobium sp.]RWL34062.1 MAG: hypothetical protein EOR63_08875 [Mesorhizobium sp.]RWL40155.1 MAG: hypothetical protein EOR59_06580 [Mesorhizobium sp.]RWL57886.1 MAG: hypothetical protein EOR62_03295 [Mesorhizobium sp.]
MAKLSAMDADIIRTVFQTQVRDRKMPEAEWRDYAERLVKTYTSAQQIDPQIIDWIIGKSPSAEGDRR